MNLENQSPFFILQNALFVVFGNEKIDVNRCEIDVFDLEKDVSPCNSKNSNNDYGFEMLVEAVILHKNGGGAEHLGF